ncbi:hypothetical protein [Hansschlegelia sp.]|uniref:hypothetical protein n=1 Tax=Hansschlegelia sp. TaxID=2041892 RepID=UPI002C2C1657|nr:hypothetical protein [Hansschlegelia sp.]HVI28353.1 hypothetical protein [Hansschlegelia sp.]
MTLKRLILVLALAAFPGVAAAQSCLRDCVNAQIAATASDIEIKDAALACRQTCEDKARGVLERDGLLDKAANCKAELLTTDELRKVRAASPSFYMQSNVFIWDAKNPFPDRVLTKIDVSAQNLDLNDVGFTGTGLVPPSGEGAFVIPGFYDGYPAVRFAAKVQKIWACKIR